MFQEYSEYKGINVAKLAKILASIREKGPAAISFSHKDLEAEIAVVEFDLILAFIFLVNEMTAHGVAVDAYLANALNDIDFKFKAEVMSQFVKFRRLNGIESELDEAFMKTKDVALFEIEKCECTELEADLTH